MKVSRKVLVAAALACSAAAVVSGDELAVNNEEVISEEAVDSFMDLANGGGEFWGLNRMGEVGEKKCPMFGKDTKMMRHLKFDACSDDSFIGPAANPTFPVPVMDRYIPGLKGMMSMFPANIPGSDGFIEQTITPILTKCMDIRAACYKMCYMPEKICDNMFKTCAKKACSDAKDPMSKAVCEKDMGLIDVTARMTDCLIYGTFQQEACACYSSAEEAEEARKSYINSFYAVYNPEKDTAPILDKIESSPMPAKKFGVLATKLLEKYPDAIVHKRDPRLVAVDKQISEQFDFGSKVYDPTEGDVVDRETGEKIDL